jgi:hypothetical protein
VVSLMLALSAGLIIVLNVAYPSMKSAPMGPSNLTQIVRDSKSLDELKKWCGQWASLEDRRADLLNSVLSENGQLLNVIVVATLIWGTVSGVGFIFIHAALRKERRG